VHIDSIEIFHIAIPLATPIRTTRESLNEIETVLVALHSGADTGWGEASVGGAPLDSA
jgi:L-alanine-DL-glutamate epimerase-like enolase superfamily enzyme